MSSECRVQLDRSVTELCSFVYFQFLDIRQICVLTHHIRQRSGFNKEVKLAVSNMAIRSTDSHCLLNTPLNGSHIQRAF
jgi:hypothetical protein